VVEGTGLLNQRGVFSFGGSNPPHSAVYKEVSVGYTYKNMSDIQNHERKWLQACDHLAGIFSTCAKRQYAAIIIAPNKRVVGFGYNGSPPGFGHCTDGFCPRLNEKDTAGSNYDTCISQHAEAGALLWSDVSLRQGGTIIVNGPPCMGCAKLIASSGLSRVVHKNNGAYAQWEDIKEFLSQCGIKVVSD
jgi:deoxycytidylate deaminase